MRSTVTVSLPEALKADLDRVAESQGVSRSDIVRESLRDYLFIREFRALRRSLVPEAKTKGIHTDQDVFDRLS
jgi:metal-responsive CopG/Arc/MetJ family transcriptional regulator